jgi:hypothetical protein
MVSAGKPFAASSTMRARSISRAGDDFDLIRSSMAGTLLIAQGQDDRRLATTALFAQRLVTSPGTSLTLP